MIELLSIKPSKHDRAAVSLDFGSETLEVPEEFCIQAHLSQGDCFSDEEFLLIKREALKTAAFYRAAAILAARPCSRRELTDKLRQKGYPNYAAEYAAQKMQEMNAIDDEQYAVLIAEHYSARGYGAGRIKDEFFRRGISREYWQAALETLETPEDVIDRFIASRLKDPCDKKAVKKVSDALFRKGFSWDDIRSGLIRYGHEE